MRTLMTWAWVLVIALGVSGCKKEEGSSGTGGSAAVTAPEAPKPLKGKDLKDADQIHGGWVTASAMEEQFAGMEFLADGKVLMSFDGGSAESMSYSVLEGGRLSMEEPQTRQLLIWNVKLAGDQMELTTERAGAAGVERESKLLRRLKKDESLAAAMSALKAERQKLAQARRDAVYALIKNSDLVIVARGEGADLPPTVAIGPENPSGQRTAIHDDKPPHRDGFTIYPGSASQQGAMTINVAYLPQVEPAPTGQARHGGNFVFEFTGDPAKPKVIAKVNYGGKPLELEMKRDAKLHGEVTGRFKAELDKIEAVKKPLIDALKDVVVLEGESASNFPSAPMNIARFTLIRDAARGVYTGEGALIQPMQGGATRSSPFTPPTGTIHVVDGKPMLFIDSLNIQYQLALDESGKNLVGGWFNPGNANGWKAALAIKSATDAETHKKHVEAQRKLLTSLSAGTPLLGAAAMPANFVPQPVPVSLALTSGADGSATGTAVIPMVGGTYDVQGQIADTLSGPRLVLRFVNLREATAAHANNLFHAIRNQPLTLAVDSSGAADAPLTLTDGVNRFTQATDAHKAQLRKALTDALAAGIKVQMVHPDYGANQPRAHFQIKLDPASGKVTGAAVGGGGRGDFHEQSTIEGEIKDVAGLPTLSVQIAHPPPARAGQFQRIYSAELVAVSGEGGWRFSGPYLPLTNLQARQYMALAQVKD